MRRALWGVVAMLVLAPAASAHVQDPLQLNDVRTLECIIAVETGQPPLRIGQRVRVVLE